MPGSVAAQASAGLDEQDEETHRELVRRLNRQVEGM
jgi:hypothetical protein